MDGVVDGRVELEAVVGMLDDEGVSDPSMLGASDTGETVGIGFIGPLFEFDSGGGMKSGGIVDGK